jgi:hypothetical protein
VGGQHHAPVALPPGKTRYPLYRRLHGPQGGSGRAKNLAPTRIRSLDHAARSQSLYRLSYPGPRRSSDSLIYVHKARHGNYIWCMGSFIPLLLYRCRMSPSNLWLGGPQNASGHCKKEKHLPLQGVKLQFPSHPGCSIAIYVVSQV